MNGDWWKQNGWIVALVGVGGFLLWYFVLRTGDGLGEQAPATVAFLSGEQSNCEEYVRKLHRERIKGEDEYQKALKANHSCVAYLRTVVVQRKGNADEIRQETNRFGKESAAFCKWADDQLKGVPNVGAVEFDPVKIITEMMKTLEWQGEKEREKLIAEIERYKFRRWDDIIKDK